MIAHRARHSEGRQLRPKWAAWAENVHGLTEGYFQGLLTWVAAENITSPA